MLCLAGIVLYNLPPLHSRLAWRVEGFRTQIRYALNPPDQALFVPREPLAEEALAQMVEATLQALTPDPTYVPVQSGSTPANILPTLTHTAPATPFPTGSPTPVPTPLPERVSLAGIRHEWQSFNNCGPANLAMALSYWGWSGDQRDTKAFLRPHPDDYNVMPDEMLTFIETQTELKAVLRVGGDLDLLKRLVAAGFPVIIEKGIHPSDDWWMGHYVVVSGYDDAWGRLIVQDSLVMADYPIPYEDVEQRGWRDFNNLYLVIYPPEREAGLIALLGEHADGEVNLRYALERATHETQALSGRDLFFAWYNKGSNLAALDEYKGRQLRPTTRLLAFTRPSPKKTVPGGWVGTRPVPTRPITIPDATRM
jgi:hypothetical protein